MGTFFTSISIINTNILSMAGKSRTILVNILGLSLVNLVFNILLVPNYGINGAAIATSISMFLLFIILTTRLHASLHVCLHVGLHV